MSDKKIESINKQIQLLSYENGLKEWKKHRLMPRELYNQTSMLPKITSTRAGFSIE